MTENNVQSRIGTRIVNNLGGLRLNTSTLSLESISLNGSEY